jgi:ParB-like chromosome segregation protein Spo0J
VITLSKTQLEELEKSEEMIQKPFKLNPELENIYSKLPEDKYKEIKADIASQGQKEPIEVSIDKTIIDGYNRYHMLTELGKKDYQINFKVLDFKLPEQLQAAKEYAYEIQHNRRSPNKYQDVTAALKVYGEFYNLEQIAKKAHVSKATVSKIKDLNDRLVSPRNSVAIAFKFQKDLETKGNWQEVLTELESAENIDNIIAVIDDKNGEVVKKIGLEKAKALKENLEKKYIEEKYKKTALKTINTELDKVVHPELYYTKEESNYVNSVSKEAEKLNKLADKFPLQVTILNCTTEEKFLDASKCIADKAGKGKLFAIVALFELPKELVSEE